MALGLALWFFLPAPSNAQSVVVNTNDSGPGSLRDAVLNLTNAGPIIFSNSLSGATIYLSSGEILITNDVTIDASALAGGLTIDGSQSSRVFEIDGGTVVLNGLTIADGLQIAGLGGGIANFGGSLLATNCVFSNNVAQGGNGQNSGEGNNGGPGGGGAGLGGGIFSSGLSLTLSGCLFETNLAGGGNGGSGNNNGFFNNSGAAGGGPNGGLGGVFPQAGNAGGFGGGGGGGSGSLSAGYDGGPGGFGGGGGGGGALGYGGNGGQGGAAGLYAGAGGGAASSVSGGGGGGAGLGGAIFASNGVVRIVNCVFNGNVATNGQAGAGSFDIFPASDGQGVGGAVFNLGASVAEQNDTFSGNIATSAPTPAFDLLAQSQTILGGTASIVLYGQLAGPPPVFPSRGEPIIASIDGISVTNEIDDDTGDFSFNFPTANLPISATPYVITYSYAGDTNLNPVTDTSTTLSVFGPVPILTWTNPVPVIYGTALSATQLNASANIPGYFTYFPAAGTILDAGNVTLTVLFTPYDTDDYLSTTGSVTLVVSPAPLFITANDATRAFGQTNPAFTGTIEGLVNGDGITATYSSDAALASPPGLYQIEPSPVDTNDVLGNYSLYLTPGTLTVTAGAQTLAHDDAAAYDAAGDIWDTGQNFGYGFQPWTILTSGGGYQGTGIGDGGNIATTNNSAWELYAGGDINPVNLAVAYRAFSNSLPVGYALKLQWRSDNSGFTSNNFAGFTLRTGNATNGTADYTNGEVFGFFYEGYDGEDGQDNVIITDGSGNYYAPSPGVPFYNISQGINIELTLLSSNTYRLVVLDSASSNTIALFDNLTLAGPGTIDSIALVDNQTGDCDCTSIANQVFNNLEISTPTIPVLPGVTVSPSSLYVLPGAGATFTAGAFGTAPFVYQWQFNGADVAGANAATFTLPSVQFFQAGQYDVVVTSPYGTVTSSNVTLNVSTPVSILVPPASAQVEAGGSATFSIVALSSSALTYQWFFDGSPIAGATNASFTVSNAQLTETGNYGVQVLNAANSSASASASLLVLPATAPLVPTYSYTIPVFTGLNLIANQLDLGGNTLNEIMPIVPDGTEAAKYDNASGTWTINTYNATLGAWSPSSIKLNPGEGAFLISPTNFNLTFSGQANVPVLPLAIPAGTAWLVSRQTNAPGTYETITGTNPVPGAVVYQWDPTNQDYVVFQYTALGWSNGVAPMAAVGESLWIAPAGGTPTPIPAAPVITQQPVSVTVAQGGSASFTVAATGSTPLFYQWQLNGNAIPGATNSELVISNVQLANVGNYTVAVNNQIGLAHSAVAQLAITAYGSLPFADDFANAGSITNSTSGTGTGGNLGATTEPGENLAPDNFLTGATVWLQWQPPAGIASLNTIGSGFDTVLAVYTGPDVADLQLVAADDDSGPNLTSALTFNASGGTTYYIQVGGFKGVTGGIVLSWNLVQTANEVPQIIVQPQDQTQTNGGPVELTVVVTNMGDGVTYQWDFQGVAIPGATNAVLDISNLTADLVGLYTVGVTNPETQVGTLSDPASVEIFNPGLAQPGNFSNVHPQDKFQYATALTPHDPNIPNDPTFAGGFTGTQIFSTAGATADVGEPEHCGYTPCHSVWYSYVPPISGELTMTTTNNFRAILEVYSGSGSSFSNLVPVACSASGTLNGESITFPVTANTNYWVVLDGIDCAFGNYSISYTLASPASFTALPIGMTLTNGGSAVLAASTAGTPPFRYQWMFNGQKITGATNSSLALSNFQSPNQGNYSVMTMNSFGTNFSAPAAVYLSTPPRFINFGTLGTLFSVQFAGAANSNYVFEASSNLTQWVPIITNNSPIGIINFYDPLVPGAPGRYYRAIRK